MTAAQSLRGLCHEDAYLGVDFSGGAQPWRSRCSRPTVWIAFVDATGDPRLTDIRPVQELPGHEAPFQRLVALLREGNFAAAWSDAPFSVPAAHMLNGSYEALLAAVSKLDDAPDRPFPAGSSLVELASEVAFLTSKKPLRETEARWKSLGVSTRSTLWNGPRGGAAFTAACLALLARAERPIWPWTSGPGMLVESFPAAQLRAWGLPYKGYAKPAQHETRKGIVAGLKERIHISSDLAGLLLENADALDAVLAVFGAMAAVRGGVPQSRPVDGLISVSDEAQANPALGADPKTRFSDNFVDIILSGTR